MVENGSANGTVTTDSTTEGNAAAVTKRSELRGRRVAGSPPPLLTDLDRSPPAPLFCTSRAKHRFFPSSLSSSSWNRSHRNAGCSTTVATEEAEASSQIPTTAPQSAHMNEHQKRNFPRKRGWRRRPGDNLEGKGSLSEISTLLSHQHCRVRARAPSSCTPSPFIYHQDHHGRGSKVLALWSLVRHGCGPFVGSARHVRPSIFVMWTMAA